MFTLCRLRPAWLLCALCCPQGGSGLLGTGTLPLAPKLLVVLPPTRMGLGKFNEHLLCQPPCWVLGVELCGSSVSREALGYKGQKPDSVAKHPRKEALPATSGDAQQASRLPAGLDPRLTGQPSGGQLCVCLGATLHWVPLGSRCRVEKTSPVIPTLSPAPA